MLSGKGFEEITTLQYPRLVSFYVIHRFPFYCTLVAHSAALSGCARMGTCALLHCAKPVSLHPLSLRTTSRQSSTGCVRHLLRRRHLYYTLASVYNGCGCAWCAVGACHPHLHLFQAPLAECHACVIFSLSILCLVSINAHSLLITLLLLFCSPEVALHVLSLSLYPLYSCV